MGLLTMPKHKRPDGACEIRTIHKPVDYSHEQLLRAFRLAYLYGGILYLTATPEQA